MHRTTHSPLTSKEWKDPVHVQQRKDFDEEIHEKLGGPLNEGDVFDDFEIPEHPLHEDKETKGQACA